MKNKVVQLQQAVEAVVDILKKIQPWTKKKNGLSPLRLEELDPSLAYGGSARNQNQILIQNDPLPSFG